MCDRARILFAERNAFYELNLPPNPKAVYLALMHRADGTKKAFPGIPALARMTGLSVRSVQRAISLLESMKLLARCAQIAAGRQTSNLYHLLFKNPGSQTVPRRHRGGRQGDAQTKETSISEQQLPGINEKRMWPLEIRSILLSIDPADRQIAEMALSKAIERGGIETTEAAYLRGVVLNIERAKAAFSGSPAPGTVPVAVGRKSDSVRNAPIRVSSPEVAGSHLALIGKLLSGAVA